MARTRMLMRLSVLALGAMAIPVLVAEEPETSPPPPATSIREWRATPSPAPDGSQPAAPVVPATSIREWRTTPGANATPAPPPMATSIREWRTTPAQAPGPCPAATPIANLPAQPAASPSSKSAAGATSPVTISIKSSLRQGNLVVVLDDVPVFNEKFQKPLLLISQTSTWDPVHIPAGTHRLTAKVLGTKKTYFSKTYDLYVSPKGVELRFVMQGDKLTVSLAS